jgi:diguanylate cyclase (GGDEF)-like protein
MNSKLEQKLAEFRVVFTAEHNDKLSAIIKLWSSARVTHSLENIKKFRFEIHNLRGSSGALNFLKLSNILGLIEQEVVPYEEQTNNFPTVIPIIDQQINSLIEASKLNPNPLLTVNSQSKLDELRTTQKTKHEISSQSCRDITIALLDDNSTTSAVTNKLLSGFGFDIIQFDTVKLMEMALQQQTFKLCIIDTNNSVNNQQELLAFASKLKTLGIDVFLLSTVNTFDSRLAAVRAKVNEYLLKPINITTLVSKIRKNFKIDLIRPFRIFLLDDQSVIGDFYKTVLENDGVEVLAINQVETLMTELESFHPDVFLLDMHMPNVSGIEVAKLLRQQSKYDYIPIVFLTADDDIQTKLAVLDCGADDVISKNTSPELIVQQVDSRIQRGQEIRYLASRDSLTGVLNHGQIMDAAAHALRLSTRHQKPISVVMIDLDNFKKVNDTYGHVNGDKVLVSLGQLLLQSVRDTDYVGRYGGEEFVVVFCDADSLTIENKLNNIRASFEQITYKLDNLEFNCTFSAGLASSENHEKLSEIIAAADSSLYQAKETGRNKVIVSHSKTS